MVRQMALERKISSGMVCAISTMEPSPTFEHRGTRIVRRVRPCHMLYHYQIHPEVGWMHARVQTWFPFNIQVGLNGREWLSPPMAKTRPNYPHQGKCFVLIQDFSPPQKTAYPHFYAPL